jgi:hypothetical protein
LTALAGVDAMAALTVAKANELPVRAERRNGLDIVVVASADGAQVVGAVNAPETVRLIECIAKGHRYGATVRSVDGPAITVNVHPL